MKNSKEREELVIKNKRLVHYLVRKLGRTDSSSDYEDLVSIGTIGLIKAANSFEPSKKIKFASYASRCINNEIYMHFRKANKYANDLYLEDGLNFSEEGKSVTIEETIGHPDFYSIEENEDFIELLSVVLNCLEPKKRTVMLCWMAGYSQENIAKMSNISQSYVSRLKEKCKKKVKEIIKYHRQYKEVFTVSIVGDNYKISVVSKNIKEFNKIFSNLLQNLTTVEDLPDFKASCNKERMVIMVPAHPESFSFIAKIIQELDEFNFSFSSDKNSISEEDNISEDLKVDEESENDVIAEETEDYAIKESFEERKRLQSNIISDVAEEPDEYFSQNENVKEEEQELKGITESSKSDVTLVSERGNITKKIYGYIANVDSFTSKQLKEQFPEVKYGTIAYILHDARKKGIIKTIDRGEYVVNKT